MLLTDESEWRLSDRAVRAHATTSERLASENTIRAATLAPSTRIDPAT
jgi:hypothetical protein